MTLMIHIEFKINKQKKSNLKSLLNSRCNVLNDYELWDTYIKEKLTCSTPKLHIIVKLTVKFCRN